MGLLVLVLAGGGAASAHQPGQTYVRVTYGGAADPTLRLSADVTLDRVDAAYGMALSADPVHAVALQHDRLEAMLAERVGVDSAGGGPAWTLSVDALRVGELDGYITLHADLRAQRPLGSAPADAVLRWGFLTDVVWSHKVYVAGVDAGGSASLIGTIAHHQPTLELTLDEGSSAAHASSTAPFTSRPPVAAAVSRDAAVGAVAADRNLLPVGFEHFRTGADHLLFLALVTLGAACRHRSVAATLRRLALLTLAFTCGHSASLAIATSGLLRPGSRVVETAIALTIVVGALQVVRPVAGARLETATTLAFGLIHGFGFAGALSPLSVHGWDLVVPVLTFNLGLELAQLCALAIIGAQMIMLSRSRVATRVAGGAAAVVALTWAVANATGAVSPLDDLARGVLASPERLAVVLLAAALAVRISDRAVQPRLAGARRLRAAVRGTRVPPGSWSA